LIDMTNTFTPQQLHNGHRPWRTAADAMQRKRTPAGSHLIRNVAGVEFPAAGLWNIPSGWARIELSLPRVFGRTLRTNMQLKQGMIAIADNPRNSTAHLSLDAASLQTGNIARDRYLHDEVLNSGRYATIPVRVAAIEHCGGSNWKAHGWITVGGVATPIELTVSYEGVHGRGSAVVFRAHANVALRGIMTGSRGLRGRFLAGQNLRISIELHAEPVRPSAGYESRSRQALSESNRRSIRT
jgi:polyisoprenoid-binding protein YceI